MRLWVVVGAVTLLSGIADWPEAAAASRGALKAAMDRGVAALKTGRFSAARDYFVMARRLAPDWPPAAAKPSVS